jgi:hypothetical protein
MWQEREAFLLQAGNRRFPALTERRFASLEPRLRRHAVGPFQSYPDRFPPVFIA